MKQFKPIIKVIEEEYEIPHLDATRRISALLPYDYERTDKKYPVLYLQDGQNLFNPNAPFGDWAIDQSLQKMASQGMQDIIVIAIDHGGTERIKEYLPYYHPDFGHGNGSHYIQFMKEKLIPYVNSHYRTYTDHDHTGIGGSSMGGLISLYAGLTEPEVFGKMMIFSPSLWVSPMIFYQSRSYLPLPKSRLYLYAGGKESIAHLPNVTKMAAILREKTKMAEDFQLEVSINKQGKHTEIHWSQEFPKALKWLFYDTH